MTSMIIRGGAMNSAVTGNGIHFEGDHVAALAGHEPIDFMVNHTNDVTMSAGTVTFPSATPYVTAANQELGEDAPQDHILNFKATLNSDYPGFGAAVQYITALRKDGRIPNVSVSIGASDIDIDMEEQKVTFLGPYTLRHLALVDRGAMRPNDGVGVFEVETPLPYDPTTNSNLTASLTAQDDSTDPGAFSMVSMTTTINLENQDDLITSFIEKHGLEDPRVAMLGKILGRDTPDAELEANELLDEHGNCRYGENEDGTCKPAPDPKMEASEAPDGANGAETLPESPQGTNIPVQTLANEGSTEPDHIGEQPMTENTPEPTTVPEPVVDAPETEEPKAPEQVAALTKELEAKEKEVEELTKKVDAYAELSERIEAIEKAGSAEKDARLTEARKRIAEKLGEEEVPEALSEMNEAQLAFVEAQLDEAAKKPAYLPESRGFVTKEAEGTFAEKQKEAQEWHKSVYIGGEA